MTTTAFVDAESVIWQWLTTTFPADQVGTETPPELATLASFTQVIRIGGPTVGARSDQATIDVHRFAPTRLAAKTGARTVQWALIHEAPGDTVTLDDGTAGVILHTVCTVGPSWRPYADTNVYLIGATYSVTVQTA